MNTRNEKPRILLVENNPRVRESYEILLRHWEYTPVLAVGEGKALCKDALNKASKRHCTLALIDLRLLDDFDEDDISGLELATQMGPTRSIILSGFPHQKILLDILENHKDIPFISKSESPEKIKQILDTEARKLCAARRGMTIEPADFLEQLRKSAARPYLGKFADQIPDILAQLFPAAMHLKIDRLDSGLYSTHASDVPRPQSVILRVYEEEYEPVVVKLARKEKIKVEVQRYIKYIDRKIGGNYAAKLERHAELWDIGGALYSYIGDFDVVTFSRYYESHTIEDIQECLESFFTASWKKHYERGEPLQDVSLFDLYKEAWGDWYSKRVRDFSTDMVWREDGINRWLELPNPIEWLKRRIAENPVQDLSKVDSTQKAVTHGDLHGDNLLVDSRKNAWVIDFERSGEGHALQDFIELESDIINRLEVPAEDPSCYYRMWLVVASQMEIKPLELNEISNQDPKVQKALHTVSILRSLALQRTGIHDARQYLLGLLFNTIFRATITNSEKHRERQKRVLMLAGIFCHRLEHWNEPWPPEEWKPILQS